MYTVKTPLAFDVAKPSVPLIEATSPWMLNFTWSPAFAVLPFCEVIETGVYLGFSCSFFASSAAFFAAASSAAFFAAASSAAFFAAASSAAFFAASSSAAFLESSVELLVGTVTCGFDSCSTFSLFSTVVSSCFTFQGKSFTSIVSEALEPSFPTTEIVTLPTFSAANWIVPSLTSDNDLPAPLTDSTSP